MPRPPLYLRTVNGELIWVVCDGDADWCGLYRDGELVLEGHLSLKPSVEVLEALGVPCETIQADPEWMEAEGRLQQFIGHVKRAR